MPDYVIYVTQAVKTYIHDSKTKWHVHHRVKEEATNVKQNVTKLYIMSILPLAAISVPIANVVDKPDSTLKLK